MKVLSKINIKLKTQEDVLKFISDELYKSNLVEDSNKLFRAFVRREQEVTTGFGKGFAIPHARIKGVKEPIIFYVTLAKDVDWKSLDGKPARYIFALAFPEDGNNSYMDALSKISSALIHEEVREKFTKVKSEKEAITLIENQIKEEKEVVAFVEEHVKKDENKYDFIAVTSCPTGVAHTNMAAEALELFAKNNNLKIKVERQGAQGFSNRFSQFDLDNTDYVLIATGRQIEGKERFNGKRVYEVNVAAPIKDAQKVCDDVKKFAKLQKGNPTSVGVQAMGSDEKISPLKALMAGLSYVIPILIVAGIFLAVGLGIGRMALGNVDVSTRPGTVWYTILQIGVAGINLAIVVLAGFAAQAIGGRLAMAPAFILAFAAQGIGMGDAGMNWMFFNYSKLDFGVQSSNLSFFGSITAAFLCGYGAKYWTRIVSPKMPKVLKTIEPIIIVPILFVLIGWLLFAFVLYLPLYYLSIGLKDGINALEKNNLLWIVGGIGGAMFCFDLGGPVNKMAFAIGVASLTTNPAQPQVMGAIAPAGTVAGLGLAMGWFYKAKIRKIEKYNKDNICKEAFVPAIFMSVLGIAEGAIPFTLKYPKTAIIANVTGGFVAGAISGLMKITDNAAHTGLIVYALGAVGQNGVTDYVYGLFYVIAYFGGALVVAGMFIFLEWLMDHRAAKKVNVREKESQLDEIQKHKMKHHKFTLLRK